MKGVILAGGHGTRLGLCTRVTNKHLLPVYDRPMIMWPLETLKNIGLTDILIVSGRGHAGHFLELLGSGKEFGVNLSYAVQEQAGGIAQALSLAKDFAEENDIAVILGDNIFSPNYKYFIGDEVERFSLRDLSQTRGMVFLYEHDEPQRFGVAEIHEDEDDGFVSTIVEKPTDPLSNKVVTGLYLYDENVFDFIETCRPSKRGELEITDVNNIYINEGCLMYSLLDKTKGFWTDAGTIESLYRASTLIKETV